MRSSEQDLLREGIGVGSVSSLKGCGLLSWCTASLSSSRARGVMICGWREAGCLEVPRRDVECRLLPVRLGVGREEELEVCRWGT